MATFAQVRSAMATAIVNGAQVRAYPTEVDQINAPCVHIVRGEFDPRMIFSGTTATYPFKVRLFARRAAERAGIEWLDEHTQATGDGSIIAAIQNGDLWPDGLVHYAQVVLVGPIADIELTPGGERYLMVEIDVEVVF